MEDHIGEIHKRIAKAAVLKDNIMDAAGPLQLCGGQEGGYKASISSWDGPSLQILIRKVISI